MRILSEKIGKTQLPYDVYKSLTAEEYLSSGLRINTKPQTTGATRQLCAKWKQVIYMYGVETRPTQAVEGTPPTESNGLERKIAWMH